MLGLGGGGSEPDEKAVWDLIFKPGQRITIWPFAQPHSNRPAILNWVTTALAPRGDFPSINMGDSGPDFGLSKADVLVVPGGNTFELLDYMRANGLVTALKEFIDAGGRYYGGSAGAVLMGSDISIIDLAIGGMDENTVGMDDTRAMDMLCGCAVYPHYEEDKPALREFCQRWAAERNSTVIAVPENCGIFIDEHGRAFNTGPADLLMFKADGNVVRREQSLEVDILSQNRFQKGS